MKKNETEEIDETGFSNVILIISQKRFCQCLSIQYGNILTKF